MKQLATILLALLLPTLAIAQDIDKKMLLVEYPAINNDERIKSIDAKTYEAKMIMNNYSQTKGVLLDTEKITYERGGYITFKESTRKGLNQKITIKVQPNHTDFTTVLKQGKRTTRTSTELQQETPITTLFMIAEIGVGETFKTKEMYNNRVVTTTQNEERHILSVDTVDYNIQGYPIYQITNVISDKRCVEYRHVYNEKGWITSTFIKTINFIKNRDGENVEEINTISQRYQYIYEDKFHNWLTRYTFNQDNKLLNITERRIDYYQ